MHGATEKSRETFPGRFMFFSGHLSWLINPDEVVEMTQVFDSMVPIMTILMMTLLSPVMHCCSLCATYSGIKKCLILKIKVNVLELDHDITIPD